MEKLIRINRCSNIGYWYLKSVGKVLSVIDSPYKDKYQLADVSENFIWLIDKDDCIEIFQEGEKVHYDPMVSERTFENGIVKEITENGIRVVYHCNEDWENYKDYTGQLTSERQLKKGWV